MSGLLAQIRSALAAQYDVQRLLGQGGMGAVFLGRDLTLDRSVAIKVISTEIAGTETSRARFLQEARVVANLRHPNIVAVHSAGQVDGQLFFVMEYVPGESLRDLMQRTGPLDAATTATILQTLALALDYAHASGIVHRDVKPENILLDATSGRAMLTDFGVARAFERDVALTGTGMVLGSPRYMSPEQATSESNIDGRSDLYALALIGYEMLTGKPVIDAPSVAGMLVKHLTEIPAPVATVVRDVPTALADAIDRGVKKAPDDRWDNGRAMAEAVGLPLPSGAYTPASGVHRAPLALNASRNRRTRRIAASAIGMLAMASAIWFWFARVPSLSAQSYVVVPFDVQSQSRNTANDLAWLREGAVSMLTMALSQWRDLNVADYERTLDLVRDAGIREGSRVSLDAARDIAKQVRAGSLVMGQVTMSTDSLIVVARLYDAARGRLQRTAQRATAVGTDPRPLFDRLARELLVIADDSTTGVATIAERTTSSLGAYRDFLQGVRALNGWELVSAESLFTRALQQDSTFALAHFKRSVTLGWIDVSSDEFLRSAERAAALSMRLSARERGLIDTHLLLSRGLHLQQHRRGPEATPFLIDATRGYQKLVAADSSSAELWYALGDAQHHAAPSLPDSESVPMRTSARRAFHRALRLDPAFHLAYSHLLNAHMQSASAGSFFVLDGDSVVDIRRLSDPSKAPALRVRSAMDGIDVARRWVNADPTSIEPYTALAGLLQLIGRFDSARTVYLSARQHVGARAIRVPASIALLSSLGALPSVHPDLAVAWDSVSDDVLRSQTLFVRRQILGLMMTAAAGAGRTDLVDSTARRWTRLDSIADHIDWITRSVHASMQHSVPASELRRLRSESFALFDSARARRTRRTQAGGTDDGVPLITGVRAAYALYMLTRDSTLGESTIRWNFNPLPEIDAAIALTRGDTIAARTISKKFIAPDSARQVGLALGGLRTLMRARVLEELGDARGAVATLESVSAERMNLGFVDTGLPLYVHSFLARGRLHLQLGDTAKAVVAYKEFLARWSVDDAVTAPHRRTARDMLARLERTPTPR